MFWFMLIAMVVVVAAVTLVVVGGGDAGGDGGGLRDAEPAGLHDPLPPDRPLARADVDAVRLPVTVRGYRMDDVDDVLDRLGAELAERDARIAELEAALAGAHASAMGGAGLVTEVLPASAPAGEPGRPGPDAEDPRDGGARPGDPEAPAHGDDDTTPGEGEGRS
ncbi:cell division protein DivIVA [Streptomyces sp. CB02959]|uniref:DivIVA domain-containing protein n=1 Tax=Streptomyces sp. CB02959 TaxID=2020330 RepID=UPI000C27C5E7|nr:DivIVA domain-containing protein [Streptomyces sp. CB02959]PJN42646.1 cell division protein DivIVA [Streptomyces sp. CB02959]